jgi:hypothetical protein
LRSVTIQCLSEAVSPITHNSGTVGNESIVAREPVRTPRGITLVPFLSGNALRHKAVRRSGMTWLIDHYGLRGNLTLPQLNFLLHGGNLTQSTAHENTRRIAEMYALWPLLRLCGGTLPDQILQGSLQAWRGTLVCEENRKSLSTLIDLPEQRLLSAEAWTSAYQYTRGDGKKTGMAIPEDAPTDVSNLMIYSGQAVSRGAIFHHGFVVQHASNAEIGALLWSLRLWQDTGGTIGGNGRIGHGRLVTEIIADIDADACVAEYLAIVNESRERAIEWLHDAFTAKADRPKKGGKK